MKTERTRKITIKVFMERNIISPLRIVKASKCAFFDSYRSVEERVLRGAEPLSTEKGASSGLSQSVVEKEAVEYVE